MTHPASADTPPESSGPVFESHAVQPTELKTSDASGDTPSSNTGSSKRIAFLVIHGIGQQRPYETLDQFARGLLRSFGRNSGAVVPWKIYPQLNICKDPSHVQEDWVRASYRLMPDKPVPFTSDLHKKGDSIEDICLYEYYWAPITQDKITYVGSLLFLMKAGLKPFLYMAANINAIGKTDPKRLVKVVLREFIRQAFLFLPLVLLLTAALAWLNSLDYAKVLEKIKNPSAVVILTLVLIFIRYLYTYTTGKAFYESVRARSGWQSSIYWRALMGLSFLGNLFLWPVLIGHVLLALAGFTSAVERSTPWLPMHLGHWSHVLGRVAVHTWFGPLNPRWHGWLYSMIFIDPSFSKYFSKALWLLLAVIVRSMLINYVGDVAVYVNASETAKNFAARAQILDECTAALTNLLKQKADPDDSASAYAYDQVYVAAHSLGSVIAYDTINLLLDRARTADANTAQVQASDLKRLRGMVTFGSPLNKIFYFFREQTDPRAALRNQTLDLLNGFRVLPGLKESVGGDLKFQAVTNTQWLDAEEQLAHGFRWINAYSIEDPVSGRLIFFDLEEVNNQKEYNWYPPIAAHLSYWKDPKFYGFVRERLL